MTRYVIRRALGYLILLFVAVTLAYLLAGTQLEPSAAFNLQNMKPVARRSVLRLLHESNLDTGENVFVRYGRWLGDVVTLNGWGVSPKQVAVSDEISTRMWVSLRLVTIGSLLGAAGGTLLGAWTATRQYKRSDRLATLTSLVIISTPTFVIGIILAMSATWLNNRTDSGFLSFLPEIQFLGETGRHGGGWLNGFLNRLNHLILPTLTLASIQIAVYSRIQRNIMLDNLNADYVRTAQAKGLTRRRAVFKHALRTSMIPTATYFAFTVGLLFTGSVFVEKIFGWHGMGEYLVDTILQQDIHGAVAASAFAGVLVVVAAILSEVFVAILDPRVRVR